MVNERVVTSKIICSCLLLFQGLFLDAYLAKVYNDNTWWTWIIADLTVLLVWIGFLMHGKQHFKRKHPNDAAAGENSHEIRFAFIFWFLYNAFLTPRIGIIFHEDAKTLDEKEVLGPNFLKMAVSCTPLVFFFLLHGSNNNKRRCHRHMSVAALAFAGAIDLFDAIDLIEFLFEPPEGAPEGYMLASLILCCVSFFLPTLTLFALRNKTKRGRVTPMSFAISYEFLNLLIINVPFLVIRSILWHNYNASVSVLLLKNVLATMVSVYEIIEYFGNFKPKKCKKCRDWFEFNIHAEHQNNCDIDRQMEDIAMSS